MNLSVKSVLSSVRGGSFLSLRNAANLLGGKDSWKQRLVVSSFGEEVANSALTLNAKQLNELKSALVSLFQANFSEEDKARDESAKRLAANPDESDLEGEDL